MASALRHLPPYPMAHHEGAPSGIRRWGVPSPVRPGRLALSDRGLLPLLLLAVAVAGGPSLGALLALAGGDTPMSFVSLVPFMGALFLLRRFDPARIRSSQRDGFIDTIALVPLCALTTFVLLLLPVMMSWDYWLDRLDIPGLVLLLMCLVMVVWGLPGVAQLGPALLYLFLAWPLPYAILYNHIIPTLTDATALATRIVAPILPLGIRPDSQDAHALLYPFQGHLGSIVVAQSCAGIDGAVGLAVIGLPIALLGRGSWEARGAWLALGIGLSWLVNVVRIVAIVAAASLWGPGVTMALLHPVLGMVLFALSFALLLVLAPLCHLDVGAPWRATRRPAARAEVPRRVEPRLALALGAILVAGALCDHNLSQFGGVSEATLPRVGLARADELFTLPTGWREVDAQTIDGWAPLFGPSTVAAALTVVTPAQPQSPVYVQAVLTRDASAFNTYGVEDCYTFHGYTLRSIHHLALGGGVTATQIDFQDGPSRAAALYWVQPVQTPQGLYHERVVLIDDTQQAGLRALAPAANGGTNPVQQVADALEEIFSPWAGGSAGPEYRAANARLQRLGQTEIARELGGATS